VAESCPSEHVNQVKTEFQNTLLARTRFLKVGGRANRLVVIVVYRQPRWSSILARDWLNCWLLVFDLCDFWQWPLARKGVIISAGDLAVSICSLCFHLAPRRFSGLKPGPVKACGLTMREAEVWESPRSQAFSLARSSFRHSGVVSSRLVVHWRSRVSKPTNGYPQGAAQTQAVSWLRSK